MPLSLESTDPNNSLKMIVAPSGSRNPLPVGEGRVRAGNESGKHEARDSYLTKKAARMAAVISRHASLVTRHWFLLGEPGGASADNSLSLDSERPP